MKKTIYSSLITLVFGSILYYFLLPAINIHSFDFWMFVIFLIAIYGVSRSFMGVASIFQSPINLINANSFTSNSIRKNFMPFIIITTIVIVIMVTNFILSPIFMSNSYSKRIHIDESHEFTQDVKEVENNKLPLLDKDSSTKLGDRVMGQMPEMVSQFYVSNCYTQINYKNNIVRVTPLEYNGFFKYINNRKNGVSGYITVDSVTGESKLVKLDKGMKYMPSAILSEDLLRHLRFSYPFDVFGTANFELDEKGNPYWVVPVIKYSGVGLKRDVKGLIVLDPITGKSEKYKVKDVPTWIDHVYESDLLIEQIDDWGKYKGGYLNSIFGQKNVVMTTRGYNYTIMNDDVYLYTGITSVSSDEANIGFVMSNLRTKETKFYSVPGADEYSAMRSAEGQVQQMKYTATFPLLINLNNKPTYLMSLKDNAGLVKQYALVDVVDYQKVLVKDAKEGIDDIFKDYLGDTMTEEKDTDINKTITVKKITSAIIDGNTYYYILDTDNNKYRVSINKNKNLLPFVTENTKLNVSYRSLKDVTELTNVK